MRGLNPMVGRRGDYLFRKPGSDVWYVRLQFPAALKRPPKKKSLGTTNRAEAEIKAAPLITEHKKLLLARRVSWGFADTGWVERVFEPGQVHDFVAGRTVVATADTLLILKDGKIDSTLPNPYPRPQRFRHWMMGNNATPDQITEMRHVDSKEATSLEQWRHGKAPSKLKENSGLAFLDRWVKDNGINHHLEREARGAFRQFCALNDDKPLSECKRSHGIKLVDYYREEGLKLPTIAKKVGHLRAMCNLAIKRDELTLNPFSDIMPKKVAAESIRREDFTEEQMALVREHLFTGLFKPDERLLWLILATTGMRRSEAWQITEEKTIEGLRCVTIGEKSTTSRREIPLPSALLPHLPAKIIGSLFPGTDPETGPINVGKRLMRRLRDDLKIEDERLVVHSLRHRAISRLRYKDVPDQKLFWIVGHNEVTAHDRYGKVPVPKLKPWIDLIGF